MPIVGSGKASRCPTCRKIVRHGIDTVNGCVVAMCGHCGINPLTTIEQNAHESVSGVTLQKVSNVKFLCYSRRFHRWIQPWDRLKYGMKQPKVSGALSHTPLKGGDQ